MSPRPHHPDDVALPARPFLYTLDQIATLLDIKEAQLKTKYIYFENRTIGIKRSDMMLARNIAPANEKPDWRVLDRELIRWFKRMGYKWYDAGMVSG